MGGGAADGSPVFDLGSQHIFLHMPGKKKEKGQKQQENQSEALRLKPDDNQDTDNLTGVCEHADDSGSEKVLHGIHIAHEAGDYRARLLTVQIFGGEADKFTHQAAAKRVGNFLATDGQKALSCRFQKSGKGQHDEIEQNQKERGQGSQCQGVDDACQHQRRHQGSQDSAADREQNAEGKEPVPGQGG